MVKRKRSNMPQEEQVPCQCDKSGSCYRKDHFEGMPCDKIVVLNKSNRHRVCHPCRKTKLKRCIENNAMDLLNLGLHKEFDFQQPPLLPPAISGAIQSPQHLLAEVAVSVSSSNSNKDMYCKEINGHSRIRTELSPIEEMDNRRSLHYDIGGSSSLTSMNTMNYISTFHDSTDSYDQRDSGTIMSNQQTDTAAARIQARVRGWFSRSEAGSDKIVLYVYNVTLEDHITIP